MRICQFFQDGSGQLSATRLAFLLWVLGSLGISAYLAIIGAQHEFKLDGSIVTLLGILMTGKVVQSFSPGDQGFCAPAQQQVSAVPQPAVAPGPAPIAPSAIGQQAVANVTIPPQAPN